MNVPPKPSTPKKVYKDGILYFTVVDYHYIDPESKGVKNGIFKSGWFPIKVFNYNHPIIIKQMEILRKQQEESARNAKVDWEKLRRTYITI